MRSGEQEDFLDLEQIKSSKKTNPKGKGISYRAAQISIESQRKYRDCLMSKPLIQIWAIT